MKNIHILLVSIACFFTSCGGDNADGSLRYYESESGYESYSLYVGSESGGVEVHTDSIKKRIDKIFPTTVFENYTNTTFVFLGEWVLIEQTGTAPERSTYKFEDNSLFIYQGDSPIYFGDGNKDAIKIRQHYIAYKQDGDKSFTNIAAYPEKTVDKDKIVEQTPFEIISNMKSEGDTLIWCTRKNAFR